MKYRIRGGNPRPLPGRKPKKPLKPGHYPHLTLRLGEAARRRQTRLADKVRELVTLLTPGQTVPGSALSPKAPTSGVRNTVAPSVLLLSLNESHFKVCERDHLGHCLPGQGTSVSPGTPGRTGDEKSASLMGKMKAAVAKAKDVIDTFNKRMEAVKQAVRSAPEQGLGEALLKWFVNAGDFSKNLTKKFYDAVASRYGHKAALTVMASGQALGWGAMAKGVYLPMVSVWGSLPAVAVAETFLQAGRLGKKLYQAHKATFNVTASKNGTTQPASPLPSGVPIRALVRQLRQGLGAAYLKYLEENHQAISQAIQQSGLADNRLFSGNAFCPTGLGGGIDPTCSPGGSSGGTAVVEGDEPQTDKRVGTVATPEEYSRAVKVAKKKFATVPAPTPKEIQEAQDGIARKGVNLYRKDLLGNSKDRKRRRAILLNEFGDGKVCPCIYCAVRIGEGTMEQDKILTTRQGGRYRVPNLLPSCSGCNKRRGDTPFSEVVKKLKA